MKDFFNFLKNFEWLTGDFAQDSILCIDANNEIKEHSYSSIEEAFVAGEEVAIMFHEVGCGELNFDALCIDNVFRPVSSYQDKKPYKPGHDVLVKYMEDNIAFTLQNDFKIKRYGIVTGIDGCASDFFENPLHPDIINAMEMLIDKFKQ